MKQSARQRASRSFTPLAAAAMRSAQDNGRGGAAPPPPPVRGRLAFSQCLSQPTASQALSAALSGCSLNSQQQVGAAGGDPPPPPPRWGAAPPPRAPLMLQDDGGDTMPLSQLGVAEADVGMLW